MSKWFSKRPMRRRALRGLYGSGWAVRVRRALRGCAGEAGRGEGLVRRRQREGAEQNFVRALHAANRGSS